VVDFVAGRIVLKQYLEAFLSHTYK